MQRKACAPVLDMKHKSDEGLLFGEAYRLSISFRASTTYCGTEPVMRDG
jgi:hypothetical protein